MRSSEKIYNADTCDGGHGEEDKDKKQQTEKSENQERGGIKCNKQEQQAFSTTRYHRAASAWEHTHLGHR